MRCTRCGSEDVALNTIPTAPNPKYYRPQVRFVCSNCGCDFEGGE